MTEPALRGQWGTQRLDDLLQALRSNGFAAGTSEAIDAARLLRRLAESAGAPQPGADADAPQREWLRRALAPLLCKESDAARRAAFDRLFDAWWSAGLSARVAAAPAPAVPAPDVAAQRPAGRAAPGRRRALIAGAGVVMLGLAVWFAASLTSVDEPPPATPGASAAAPATRRADNKAGAAQPLRPAGAGAVAPTAAASAPLDGWQPAFVSGRVLRPAIAWALVLAPLGLLALLAWRLISAVPWLAAGGAGRPGRTREVVLDGWTREEVASRLTRDLDEATVGRLERHVRGTVGDWRGLSRRPQLDVARTVDATLRALGVPRLRFRQALLRPRYRVLVEADDDAAPAMLWAERLCTGGADSALWRVQTFADGSEAVCHGQRVQAGRQRRFGQLAAPAPGERLVLVSDGAFLLRGGAAAPRPGNPTPPPPDDAVWHDWARDARLERWPMRVVFTPREWRHVRDGVLAQLDRPLTASDPGFLLLPQEDAALSAWTNWLARGHLPPILLGDRQSYPRLLTQIDEALWLGEIDAWPKSMRQDNRRVARQVAQLVAQLHLYLGENGFYWLCCCAVPPLMRTGLTLQLGQAYLQGAGADGDALRDHLADNYRRLARLPWLVHQRMPRWLRLALLARLPSAVQQEVKRVVERLLDPQQPAQRGDLRLSLALPALPASAASPAPAAGAATAPPRAHDPLFVGFMSGLSAQQLALRLPGSWRAWLGELDVLSSVRARAGARLRAMVAGWLFNDGLPSQGIARRAWGSLAALTAVSLAAAAAIATQHDVAGAWRDALFVDSSRLLRMQHDGGGAGGDRVAGRAQRAPGGQVQRGGDGDDISKGLGVRFVAFSADGTRVLSAGHDGRARLWDAATGAALGEPMAHGGPITAAEFSADGTRVVTAGMDGTARVWSGNSGQPLTAPLQDGPADQLRMTAARFSPDGKRVLTTHLNGRASIWDAASGRLLTRYTGHPKGVYDGAFGPDGGWVATQGSDGDVRLWNAQTGATESELKVDDPGTALRVSSAGDRLLLSGGSGARVANIGVIDGRPVVTHAGPLIRHPTATRLSAAAFSADGRRLATASRGQVQLWDVSNVERPVELGRQVRPGRSVGTADEVTSLAFSADGRQLLTGDEDGGVRLWQADRPLRGLTPLGMPLQAGERVTNAAFSADATRLVTGGWHGGVQVWADATPRDAATPVVVQTARSASYARTVVQSADGRVALVDLHGRLHLWRPATGDVTLLALPAGATSRDDALSEDGLEAAAQLDDGTLLRWDIRDPAQPRALPVSAAATAASKLPGSSWLGADGRSLLNVDADTVRWLPIGLDVPGPERAALALADTDRQLAAALRSASPTAVAFDAHGRHVAMAINGRVWTFDLTSGLRVGPVIGGGQRITGAMLSPDGRRLALVESGQLQFFDTADGARLASVTGNPGRFAGSQFSPDGQTFALIGRPAGAGSDAVVLDTVALLRVATGGRVGTVAVADDAVASVRFSPDSRMLATVEVQGAVHLWSTRDASVLGGWRAGWQGDGFAPEVEFGRDGRQLLVVDVAGLRLAPDAPAAGAAPTAPIGADRPAPSQQGPAGPARAPATSAFLRLPSAAGWIGRLPFIGTARAAAQNDNPGNTLPQAQQQRLQPQNVRQQGQQPDAPQKGQPQRQEQPSQQQQQQQQQQQSQQQQRPYVPANDPTVDAGAAGRAPASSDQIAARHKAMVDAIGAVGPDDAAAPTASKGNGRAAGLSKKNAATKTSAAQRAASGTAGRQQRTGPPTGPTSTPTPVEQQTAADRPAEPAFATAALRVWNIPGSAALEAAAQGTSEVQIGQRWLQRSAAVGWAAAAVALLLAAAGWTLFARFRLRGRLRAQLLQLQRLSQLQRAKRPVAAATGVGGRPLTPPGDAAQGADLSRQIA